MQCASHPAIETELACGKCGRAICARCSIMTPAGQRCRECAQLRRPPMYEVGPRLLALASLTSLAIGVAGGVVWLLLLPLISVFPFGIFLLAIGFGYVLGRTVSRASRYKRGYPLQLIAAFGSVIALVVRNLLGAHVLLIPTDLFGYLAVALAIVMAISPLR